MQVWMRAATMPARWMATIGAMAFLAGCAPSTSPVQASSEQQKKGGKRVEQAKQNAPKPPAGREYATLASGCFWCTEAIFQDVRGIDSVQSGYAGGSTVNPTYKQVCSGNTGHAEAVQIVYDPKVVAFKDLLRVFFTTHDPTTLNRQGADVGTQYRSAVFYHSEAQRQAAKEVIAEIQKEGIWKDPIVTEVTAFTNFYPAEDYHNNYFKDNPNQGYCQVVIAPKVAKFREKYRAMLKKP